ncbi:MAG: glutamate synthase-related protein [Saprospiraceae bacterium]
MKRILISHWKSGRLYHPRRTGGGTGAAPAFSRNNINVPTIPALARAWRHLDKISATDVTLVITGGLRVAEDFAKAMMLGRMPLQSNSARAIGCLGMQACNTNNCPVGIAAQKDHLQAGLKIEKSADNSITFRTSTD